MHSDGVGRGTCGALCHITLARDGRTFHNAGTGTYLDSSARLGEEIITRAGTS